MKKVVTFGEIMLRLATPGYQRFGQADKFVATYGGGEANVAVSLANYNIPATFITRLPENDIAQACIKQLNGFGVDTSFIARGGERMGIYFLETGSVNRASKVIYDRAHSAFSEINDNHVDWDMVFEDAIWFHWSGITPAISQKAADVCLSAIKKAKEKNVFISTDLNYRKNLWKYGKKAVDVMPVMVQYSDLIMGNEEDAAMTLDIEPVGVDVTKGEVDSEAYINLSKKIINSFPQCKYVATTLRSSINANHNKWTAILFDGKKFYKAQDYDLTHIVDRVGGGDSFMAGLIYGMLAYDENLQKTLEFATAASALKHTVYGDFNRVTVEEVERLMSGDKSGRVNR